MVKLVQTLILSTELSIAYSPCYKLDAFDGFQFVVRVFRQLAYNGYWYDQFGINELKLINYARK